MNRKELTVLCNDITLALMQPVMIKSGYQCNDCGTYNKPDYMFNEKKCMDCVTLEEAEERGVQLCGLLYPLSYLMYQQ